MTVKAAWHPERFEDTTLHIQTSASTLSQRFRHIHELANARQVIGSAERVSGGGISDTTSGTLVSNERALADLAQACEQVNNAWNSLTAAHGKLTAIEKAADQRAEKAEQAQPAERLREAMTRGELARVLIRNRVALTVRQQEEAAELDAKIRPLFHHVDADDADDVIRAMETRVRQIRIDGEKEAERLEREVKRLRTVIAKARHEVKVKANVRRSANQWDRSA